MLRAAVLAVACLGGVARADDRRLDAARAAYQQQADDQVVRILSPILAASPWTGSPHDLAAAARIAGCALMVNGDRTGAEAAFERSFAIEPDGSLEPYFAQSPDARALFENARGAWRARMSASIADRAADLARLQTHIVTPPAPRGGEPLPVDVTVSDPGKLVGSVELSYRVRGHATFARLHAQAPAAGRTLHFEIPTEATTSRHGVVLEYDVTLRHATGLDLHHDGDFDRPLHLAISPGHPPRWYESWWFRAAVGAAVIGVGAAGYLIYDARDVGPPQVVVTGR